MIDVDGDAEPVAFVLSGKLVAKVVRLPQRVDARGIRRAVSFKPSCSTWSRHGAIPRIRWRAQPAMMSLNCHRWRTVAVLSESSEGSGPAIYCFRIGVKRRDQPSTPWVARKWRIRAQ